MGTNTTTNIESEGGTVEYRANPLAPTIATFKVGLDWERLAKAGMGRPAMRRHGGIAELTRGQLRPREWYWRINQSRAKMLSDASNRDDNENHEVAAALWRDAAVRFLGERGQCGVSRQGDGWNVHYRLPDTEHPGMLRFYVQVASTPDEALWSAVSAVLTAEGKL